jgi:spore coat polysaccharide biosynthesis predicted glycosyltransferase SpsG
MPPSRTARPAPRLGILCDAGPTIGLGHLRRCLVIAEAARRRGIEASFAIGGSTDAGAIAGRAGFAHAASAGLLGPAEAEAAFRGSGAVLLDLVHPARVADPPALAALAARLARSVGPVAALDGLAPIRMGARWGAGVSLLVSPYLDAPDDGPASTPHLRGAAYCPLDPAYRGDHRPRPIARRLDRVLVTPGGSDPFGIALLALAALALVPGRLRVTVALGRLVPARVRLAVAAAAARSPHAVRLVRDLPNLAAAMRGSDLAIAGAGLIKYELAATGTPAILIPGDAAQEAMNASFSATGAAVSVGAAGNLTPEALGGTILRLANSRAEREAMSAAGRTLVDGHGAARIVEAVMEMGGAEA